MGVPGCRDFSFHAFSDGTTHVLFCRRSASWKAQAFVSQQRIENFSCSIVEGRPFETKDLLFSTYELDSGTRLHEYDILTYARLRDRGSSRSWSRQVYTHTIWIFIIDTIADSLWYFNDTAPRAESVIPPSISMDSVRFYPPHRMNYSTDIPRATLCQVLIMIFLSDTNISKFSAGKFSVTRNLTMPEFWRVNCVSFNNYRDSWQRLRHK